MSSYSKNYLNKNGPVNKMEYPDEDVKDNKTNNGSCKEYNGITADNDCNTTQCGRCAGADGCNTKAFGECSHSEGCSTKAMGDCSHAEGSSTIAYSDSSHVEGLNTKTRGLYSHAEGNASEANGDNSHAQGINTRAEGYASFSTGGYTTARGNYSHTEGYNTTSTGNYSHAEGYYTTTTGSYSHAEGYNTNTTGGYSHAEGIYTLAADYAAHAEGYSTCARAPFSHAEGYYTDTKSNPGAHIMGMYGDADTPYSWFLAGGSYDSRALAAKILYTGDAYIKNAWQAGGTGYAEMYKPFCGELIAPGYFVTLDGEFIKIASDNDKFILGVATVSSGFVANSPELGGRENYLLDNWGNPLYEEVLIQATKDEDGNVLVPEQILRQPIQRVKSAGPNLYTTSVKNDALTSVVLLGQVLVSDDGTCTVNGYCLPNENGIATASPTGYRVMKRISDNQILIFFR